MKNHKNIIIIAVVVLALLTGAWFYGGDYSKPPVTAGERLTADGDPAGAPGAQESSPTAGGSSVPGTSGATVGPATTGDAIPSDPSSTTVASPSAGSSTDSSAAATPPTAASSATGGTPGTDSSTASTTQETGNGKDQTTPAPGNTTTPGNTTAPGDTPSPGVSLPPSDTPDNTIADDGSFTVTLAVRCDTLLNNLSMLNKDKHELVPADGVIFPTTSVTAYEGESVFNVLLREMRKAGVHMAFRNTPLYNSAYIEAINNLYEFDAGELSGWVYSVNDVSPNYGCSRYQLKPGDVIELRYTCDLGKDLGLDWISWGQRDG